MCEATSGQAWALRPSVRLPLLTLGLRFPTTVGRDTCLARLSGLTGDKDCPDRENGLNIVTLTLLLPRDSPSPSPSTLHLAP